MQPKELAEYKIHKSVLMGGGYFAMETCDRNSQGIRQLACAECVAKDYARHWPVSFSNHLALPQVRTESFSDQDLQTATLMELSLQR
jgi:hypothetical protein